MGSLYRSRHELVFVYKKAGRHQNNVQLGRHGRNRTNVWECAGVNSLDPERRAELELHPTVKPVELVADAILDASSPGDIVLDPFIGSGTTLIAAEKTRRVCAGIEIDPFYIDTAIRRWQAFTGQPAVHAVTRASAASAKIEAGHVLIPKTAPWLEDLKTEVLAFPHGRYDDQVDSMTQFLNWITYGRRRRPKLRGYGVGAPRGNVINRYLERNSGW
jgi:hypothetical protein